MADFDNNNRGSIWKNEKKEKDTHPDFTGSLNVDGVEYWVSAWKRKDGASPKAPALSFSIKPKEDKPQQQSLGSKGRSAASRPDPISSGRSLSDDLDDSIPFAPEFR